MEENIMVSISCTTYNHAKYIRQCLDGFLMQECDFNYEILIHDDASTDGTIDIIKEYQEKYPEIIKPYIQKENQWSKGVRGMNAKYNFSRAKGKYVALCEGDDYWTDPLKLQKQVDFLEQNEDCSMVFADAAVIFESQDQNNNTRGLKQLQESRYYAATEIIEDWIVPTATVLFPNKLLDSQYYEYAANKNFMFGDTVLFLFLSTKGKLYGMKEKMASYRRHPQGATNVRIDINYYKRDYVHLNEVIKVFGPGLKTLRIKKRLADYALSLFFFSISNNEFIKGIKYLKATIIYDIKPISSYIKSKIVKN